MQTSIRTTSAAIKAKFLFLTGDVFLPATLGIPISAGLG